MFYAVIEDGSRQYRVGEGDLVTLDYRDVEKGSRLELGKVLLYKNGDDLQVGLPLLDGYRVVGEVMDFPSIKTDIQKYRRRKGHRRAKGHRQWYTRVRVQHILSPGQQPPAREEKPKEEPKPEQPAETT